MELADRIQALPPRRSPPNFEHLLAVLARKVPPRPTLFEFTLNPRLVARLRDDCSELVDVSALGLPELRGVADQIGAYYRAGYDFAPYFPSWSFLSRPQSRASSISLNEGAMITDRPSFETYRWPEASGEAQVEILERLAEIVPSGMKLITYCPGGVLENVIKIVGYESLCYMLGEEPELCQDIFNSVGSHLLDYQQQVLPLPIVGACMCNDDWGFKTQTMLSPRHLRELVFPWHQRMAEAAHELGKPAILHSCGHFELIIDDIVDTMAFDARHSYEDAIMPVEAAYEKYHERIAVLGGLDVDFVTRAEPMAIYRRARQMLDRVAERGGYALGTGNSVPDYVPDENYFAMIAAAYDASC